MIFTLSKRECVIRKMRFGYGFYSSETEGLFRKKITREGVVSDVLGRWIRNERPGMDPGGERRRWPAGTVTPMANSIAGGMEVTGARGQRPTGHGSEIRRHREKAEEEGNSARAKKWPEE